MSNGGMGMEKVIIVEDDEKLRNEVAIFLERNGYQVVQVEQFDNTLERIIEAQGDLVLLDINLPNMDGEFILREFRKVSDIPVIMITSRDNELDELMSMNYGADHYVTKPFHIQILLAKMVAILRRAGGLAVREQVYYKDCMIDFSKGRMEKGDVQIELTGNESKIMKILLKNKGKIVLRDDLMEELWDSEAFIDDNTLTVNITRIRNKLNKLGLSEVIETKRGQGYRLAED